MSLNKYYYLASIKSASSVTQCIKARLTYSPISDKEFEQQNTIKSSIQTRRDSKEGGPGGFGGSSRHQGSGTGNEVYQLDTNMIIARSNTLSIFKITETSIDQVHEYPFNDQIISILRVPSGAILEKAGRNHNPDQQQDYIFVLTSEFNAILLGCHPTQGLISMSNGNISDNIGQKREPPFSVFLGTNEKYIGLMIYENIIKIIPLIKTQQNRLSLSNAFNVRIRHPDVSEIIPLYEPSSSLVGQQQSDSTQIAVFFQQRVHKNNQPLDQLKMRKYELNLVDKDLVSSNPQDDLCEFDNTNIYKVMPLEFGGFLAFEPDFVHVYKRRVKSKLLSKKLRTSMIVKAVCNMDKFNPVTKLTEEGKDLMRYLIATNEGEIYMMGFYLEALHLITGIGIVNQQEANTFMIVEFLASKLSSCSTLQYIEDGYFYYGSRIGDSYLIKLMTENQGNPDQPYIQIVRTYHNLGPIRDLVFKNNLSLKGQQNELYVLGGSQNSSHITLLKKGISIKSLMEISDLPSIEKNGLFTLGNRMFVKFYGVEQIVVLEVIKDANNDFVIGDSQLPETFLLTKDEQLISLNMTKIEDQINVIVLGTNKGVRVINDDLSLALAFYELDNLSSLQNITQISLSKDNLLISLNGGILQYFSLNHQGIKSDQVNQKMSVNKQYQFQFDISQICLSEENDFASVCLWDAPYYSLVVLNPKTMDQIAKRSIACYVQKEVFQEFFYNNLIKKGTHLINDKAKNYFSKSHNESQDEDQMQIDSVITDEKDDMSTVDTLNSNMKSSAVTSMVMIYFDGQEHIICGLEDGKIFQICLDVDIAVKILTQPDTFPPQLSISKFMESTQLNFNFEKNKITGSGKFEELQPSVLWNAIDSQITCSEINLKRINMRQANEDGIIIEQKCIFACSDKPALFYLNRDQLSMQYVNSNQIVQVNTVEVDQKQVILLDNGLGSLILGETQHMQQIQLKQSYFQNEITNACIIPNEDLMVVLQECPNFEYMQQDNPSCNKVVLMSKTLSGDIDQEQFSDGNGFRTYFSYDLEKEECPNCITFVSKKYNAPMYSGIATDHHHFINAKTHAGLVLIGTCYIDLNESIPKKGRLLIFNIDSVSLRLNLVHMIRLEGSVMAIQTLKDDHKYLVLGINNQTRVFAFNMKNAMGVPEIKLDFLQSKEYGSLIMDIKTIQNTIAVGDIQKAIILYDFKEGRNQSVMMQQNNKLLNESAHANDTIWVKKILPLSSTHFIVFDNEKNIFIYQRSLLPTNDKEKYKLNLIGCFRNGEIVTSAVFGTLNIQQDHYLDKNQMTPPSQVQSTQPKSYMINKTRSSKKKLEDQLNPQIQGQIKNQDEIDEEKLKSDKDYIRQVCIQALKDVKAMKVQHSQEQTTGVQSAQNNFNQTIIFGTQEGSLGTLIPIPEKAYRFLELLQIVQEKEGVSDFGRLSRLAQRSAKTDSLKKESFNIIDGDFVEMFLGMDGKQTNMIVQHLLLNSKDFNTQFVKEIKSLLETLKDMH